MHFHQKNKKIINEIIIKQKQISKILKKLKQRGKQ